MPTTAASSLPRCDVILPDGQTFHLRGRSARMVAWIARQAAALDAPHKGRLLFSFAGQAVVPELTQTWEPVDGP